MNCRSLVCLLSGLLLLTHTAWAELSTDHVKAGKAATALVEIRNGAGKSYGSAFCIDGSGIFITNAHVAGTADKLRLILTPGESGEDATDARVLRVDREADLAILQVAYDKPLTALPLGTIDDLIDTMPVTAFGYPFGSALAMDKGEYPSISVNTGRVTSLRKKKGELELIQLDAALNPGNSGGPVLDDKGRVVGIVKAGVPGSGVNFAIPVNRLETLVARPEIVVAPTTLPYEQRNTEQAFSVRVVALTPPRQPYVVTMSLGDSDARPLTAKAGEKNLYTVRAVPVPLRTGPQQLVLTARFSQGSITCRVDDKQLTLGSEKLQLAQIARIDRTGDAPPTTTTVDGKTLSGEPAGMKPLEAHLGEQSLQLDLSKAQSVQIEPAEKPSRSIAYKVAVAIGSKVVGETSGSIELLNAPAAAARATPRSETREAPLEDEIVRRKLPAPVDNVIAGGSGRYLLLHLKKLRKLAVFDVSQAKVTQYLPLASDDVLIAANAEKLVIVARDQNVMQKWDLATLQKELTAPLPEGQLDDVAMGHAGNGPLLMMTRNGPRFYDVATLSPSETKTDRNLGNWNPHPQYPLQVRASADGSTFAAWEPGLSPMGIRTLTLEGDTARARYEHTTAGVLMPSFDGALLFTGQGLFSGDLKPISPELFRGVICLPSYNPAYFVGLRLANFDGIPRQGAGTKPGLSIYTTADRRLLITLSDLADLPGNSDQMWGRRDGLSIDQRIHFMPDANLLLTIGENRDELVLRRFQITDALDKAGLDYLFVTSIPPKSARRGQGYHYEIVTRSKRGGVKYALDGAPQGMTLSPGGQIDWAVPADQPVAKVSVIVSIRDASGQEVFHSYPLSVE